jgi:hypothetical protein
MLKTKNHLFLTVVFSLLLVIGFSKFLLFMENSLQPIDRSDPAPLTDIIIYNQMTNLVEDGYLK